MNAGGDDLLTVTHEFDFFAGAAVGGDQVDGDLGEGIDGAKRNRALGRPTDTRQNITALFEAFADQFLDCDGGGLVENIGVERRREFGQNAGIASLAANFFPTPPALRARRSRSFAIS